MKTKSIAATALAIAAILAAGAGAVYLMHDGAPEGTRTPSTLSAKSESAAPALAPVEADAVAGLLRAPLTDADGKPRALDGYRGRVLVVNFWASWCGPCVREMPTLAGLAHEYAGKGVTFVGIGVDSASNVQTFLHKVPVDYPVYVSGFGGADLARSFGNVAGGLPFTVVIDANGTVKSTKLGEVVPDELRHTLDALRAQPTS
jgi:thiol-disulfide isomerase/thioredoxin